MAGLMALKSTIYKANLQIADIDNSYYADHALTLARHPSETDERMMVRLVALALNAYQLQSLCNGDGTLAFVWAVWTRKTLTRPHGIGSCNGKRLWMEVGRTEIQTDFQSLQQSRCRVVVLFCPLGRDLVEGIETKLTRLDRLQVWRHLMLYLASPGQAGPAQHAVAGHGARGGADAGRR